MDNKFTVIKTSYSENDTYVSHINKVSTAWGSQFFKLVNKAICDGYDEASNIPQERLTKMGLSGVKYICSWCSLRDARKNIKMSVFCGSIGGSYDENEERFQLLSLIFSILGAITLRNFVTTFPITKKYDGEKWECKDYFFTMEILSQMDWDKPIGSENVLELLWDYMNDDLRKVNIEYMSIMSKIYRSQTGKGMIEQFCEDNGIDTYTVDRNTGIIRNNQTGGMTKLNQTSHLKIVK